MERVGNRVGDTPQGEGHINRGDTQGIERLVLGVKLIVSNLNYDIMSADIEELFSTVGELSKAEVKFDRSGRSLVSSSNYSFLFVSLA